MMLEISNVIPPRSLVELIRADDDTPRWKDRIGKIYRIGYYNPQDGLDTIWLVDENVYFLATVSLIGKRFILFHWWKFIDSCWLKYC